MSDADNAKNQILQLAAIGYLSRQIENAAVGKYVSERNEEIYYAIRDVLVATTKSIEELMADQNHCPLPFCHDANDRTCFPCGS